MDKKISNLLSLLDDENEQVANIAMAELFQVDINLDEILKEFQEDSNPLLRKRIHQLQIIQTRRAKRKKISILLKNNDITLIDGLMALHSQWYDKDSKNTINQYWLALIENFKNSNVTSLNELGTFMKKHGFKCANKDEIDPDYFCFGLVLEDLVGADFILCSIAYTLAQIANINLKTIFHFGDFVLIDSNSVLSPKNAWFTNKYSNIEKSEIWDTQSILKLNTTKLFLSAVSSDSFRYVKTFGLILSEAYGKDELSLPYPYSGE